MALVDGYDPGQDKYVDLYVYAVRHLGPGPDTVRRSGDLAGTKLGRKATHVRHLLRELAIYADWDTGGRCYPDQERLAQALAVQRTTVSATLADAIAVGWLAKVATKRRGRDWALSHYQLLLPPGVHEQAEAHARGRRESRQPEGDSAHGDLGISANGRRKTGQPRANGRRVIVEGCLENEEGRRENRPEVVGKADTNPSVNPSSDPLKETNARGDVFAGPNSAPADVDVPTEFDAADHGLDDLNELFRRVTRNPGLTVLASRYLSGRGLLGRGGLLGSARDLGHLRPDELRAVAYVASILPGQR